MQSQQFEDPVDWKKCTPFQMIVLGPSNDQSRIQCPSPRWNHVFKVISSIGKVNMEIKMKTVRSDFCPRGNPFVRQVFATSSIFAMSLFHAAIAHASSAANDVSIITVGVTTPQARCDASNIAEAIAQASKRSNQRSEIRISRNGPDDSGWKSQNLFVDALKVKLVGGFETCTSHSPRGSTTISASGGRSEPVLTIRGTANVTLQNLRIADGDVDSEFGGGIDFRGSGILSLENVSVESNNGALGGGIHLEGTVGVANLQMLDNVRVAENSSNKGGGIYIAGRSILTMIGRHQHIWNNVAYEGGGIFLQSPAHAEIGAVASRGEPSVPMIRGNRATYGAGLLVERGDATEGGQVLLYSTDPVKTLLISENEAGQSGGALGIFGNAMSASAAEMIVCVDGVSFERNTSPAGTSVEISGIGAALELNSKNPICRAQSERQKLCAGQTCAEAQSIGQHAQPTGTFTLASSGGSRALINE